jgi:hypothetical protein
LNSLSQHNHLNKEPSPFLCSMVYSFIQFKNVDKR